MFLEMVDKFFETQGQPGEWTDPAADFQERVEAYATELGLDVDLFLADQAWRAMLCNTSDILNKGKRKTWI